jgi:adenylyltransferase/sulfurtransferase
VTALIDYEDFCGVSEAEGRGERRTRWYRPRRMRIPEITVEELKAMRDRGEKVTLVDVREPHEWAVPTCRTP